MRRTALFLFTFCFALFAAERTSREAGRGVLFQEEEPEQEEEARPDLSPPDDIPASEIEDTKGNYRIELLAGWAAIQEVPEDPKQEFRFAARRRLNNGAEIAELEVYRFTFSRPETFTIDTPADVLDQIEKGMGGFIERYFGEGSKGMLQPEMDEGTVRGGADKSGEFTYRGRTMKEQAEIDEAERRKSRGDKTVEIPVYPERLVRGRIAMVSPCVYLIRVFLNPGLSDDETMNAEATAIMDSFKFLVEGEIPPPLRLAGEQIEDTTKDPANQDPRKETVAHEVRGRRKTWTLGLKFTVPAGMTILDEKKRGAGVSVILYGQDERNNWAKVVIAHFNHQKLSEQRQRPQDAKTVCNSWRSNYESKMRGAKIPSKPQAMRLGPFSGKGFKRLAGKVEKFPGSFSGLVADKSQWRTQITVETRGDPKTFEKRIKAFFKSLKVKYK